MKSAAEITKLAHDEGDVRHTECACCSHAAMRTVGLREAIQNAIDGIKAGYPGETMCELDRVLSELDDWCNSPAPLGGFDRAEDDKVPF